MAGNALAITYIVDRTDDSADASATQCTLNPNDCSLRGAVIRANADSATNQIILPASGTPYTLSIPIGAEPNNAAGADPTVGDLDILQPLVITGAGPGQSVIEGDPGLSDRLLHSRADLTLSGITLKGATSFNRGGGIWAYGASLTATDCEFRDNSGVDGAGLSFDNASDRTLTVRRSLFAGNTAVRGGAMFFETGDGTIESSTFSGNIATFTGGGAISVDTSAPAGLRISHSTFVGNRATDPAGVGGAIRNQAKIVVRNSVFSDNTANGVPSSCGGGNAVASQGHNVLDDTTCGFAATGDREGVGSTFVSATLADNGGPTETHDLPDGSVAVDLIPAASCTDADGVAILDEDQRGFTRPAESDGGSSSCDAGAIEVGCGDAQVRTGEACDDGNDVNTDACTTECTAPACGDGYLQGAEECDDGNMNGGDGCSAACSDEVVATCGDGILQAGEECDDGGANSDVTADACRTDCRVARCGDGVRDAGEECDDGGANSDTAADACRTTCVNAFCGDGFPDSGEDCDDANLESTDDCVEGCVAPTCGDGILYVGTEDCDDGNDVNTDDCLDTCVAASCGDGFVHDGSEECDDGNANDGDACPGTCANARCGDGFLHEGVETCDDGNFISTDACVAFTCEPAKCGDGHVQAGEECDDGNQDFTDECVKDCQLADCLDGYVWDGEEQCDDGNPIHCDGCGTDCTETIIRQQCQLRKRAPGQHLRGMRRREQHRRRRVYVRLSSRRRGWRRGSRHGRRLRMGSRSDRAARHRR